MNFEKSIDLLFEYSGNEDWFYHCVAVSKTALELVGSSSNFEQKLDLNFIAAGAVLHDIGRYRTHHPILHGVAGYYLLNKKGFKRLSYVCAAHILCGMDSNIAESYGLPARDFYPETLEEKIITISDLLCEGDSMVALEKRFNSLKNRYRKNRDFYPFLKDAEKRANLIKNEIEKKLKIKIPVS